MSMKRSTLRSMIVSAMMTALAITLPMAFHAVGLGSKFLPMSLPLLAGVASVLYRATRRRMWPALLCAIVLSRAVSVLLTWFFVAKFHLPGALAAGAVLVEGLPGAALQVILIPLALKGLQRRRSLLFGDED
jgi:hypothetical protein